MDSLLDAALGNVIAEVARIREETKSGILRWDFVPGMSCTYTLLNGGTLLCTLQCCQPDYVLSVNDNIVKIPQDLLESLCETIKQQVKRYRIQDTVSQLKSIKRQEPC